MLRIALVTSPIIAVLPALAVHFSGVTDIGLAKSFAFGLALAAMSVGFAVSSALGAVRDAGSATLRAGEIDVLESSTSDALRRRYLALVQVVARMRIPESSAEDVRSVLRAMGDALDRLPDVAAGICDGACLQEAAATTRQQALRETDSVVANSLHGRADILERRARLQADSGHLLRRIAAARAEVDEQIQAVHEQICVLAGAEANPTVKLPIPDLAEACRRLAFLTTAMASAVEELDSAPSWVAWAPDRCSAVTVPQERIRYQTLQRKQ